MLGKITQIQEKNTLDGKKFLILHINGEIISTFYNTEWLLQNLKVGDDVEYEYSKKEVDGKEYKNMKSIKILRLEGKKLPEPKTTKNKISNINTKSILEDSIDEVISVLKGKSEKYPDIESFKHISKVGLYTLAAEVFRAKVQKYQGDV